MRLVQGFVGNPREMNIGLAVVGPELGRQAMHERVAPSAGQRRE
jgi:hypothetical protein